MYNYAEGRSTPRRCSSSKSSSSYKPYNVNYILPSHPIPSHLNSPKLPLPPKPTPHPIPQRLLSPHPIPRLTLHHRLITNQPIPHQPTKIATTPKPSKPSQTKKTVTNTTQPYRSSQILQTEKGRSNNLIFIILCMSACKSRKYRIASYVSIIRR